ncbi:MAG TPA: efflux RND transporter periplasmic adaptor subunit [Methylomirabilota bacterium]|jgi:HlyD family secretion protein|nr:efflux RND transporter periplasmic adaptor subunit [Methylomirabilota bacterium]
MRSAARIVQWLVIVVVVLGSVVWLLRARAKTHQPALRYETVTVDQGQVVAKVTATGTLSALVTVQVGSQVSGRIQQIFVDFNSPVKKGQLIAKIDPQLFEAAVEQARANYVAARGNLAKAQAQAVDAERQYRRARALAERQLIAQAEVDTAQTNANAAQAQVKVAEGSVEQARAALHQAEVNLAYTNIISPTNGVVISRNVDVGQTVAASLQAPTLFLIAEDLAKMQVDTSVAEADVGRLWAGMTASFTIDAYPNERFTGRVRQIRNAPQTVQNVVTYDAVIDVDNAELKLRPGMTANVTFVYAERANVMRVPNAALRFRPSPELLAKLTPLQNAQTNTNHDHTALDQRTVWVLRDHTPRPVPIRLGISDGTVTEVLEGELRIGDRVITDVVGGEERPQGARPMGPGGFRRLF